MLELFTRSKLLESKFLSPDMSTSPSGLDQAEQPRQSHPETVQAFNVAPAVQLYIDGLPAEPECFNPIDYKQVGVSQSIICTLPSINGIEYVLACVQFAHVW